MVWSRSYPESSSSGEPRLRPLPFLLGLPSFLELGAFPVLAAFLGVVVFLITFDGVGLVGLAVARVLAVLGPGLATAPLLAGEADFVAVLVEGLAAVLGFAPVIPAFLGEVFFVTR